MVQNTIIVNCQTCKVFDQFPNKGLGRAFAATWLSRHQGHKTTREVN